MSDPSKMVYVSIGPEKSVVGRDLPSMLTSW
jgi:hypothetical protein